MNLPSDEQIYPYDVKLRHLGDTWGVALKVVKWLESQKIMTNTDFLLQSGYDEDRIAVRFRKKKHARLFKQHKKAVRDEA